ncbi:MAG: class I SAM-dependent methyltransferase [Acidobacteriota bacterium]
MNDARDGSRAVAWAHLRDRYRRAVPAAVRDPIGRARRRLHDRALRLISRRPLPPRAWLDAVQLTPWAMEYLRVGRRSAASVLRHLEPADAPIRAVLDFGCGLGRTLRHLERPAADRGWQLAGCDVDRRSVDWCARHLPFVAVQANAPAPPLPYDDGVFDAVYAISVFTHFDRADQRRWADEMARVLRPGGVLIASTMGPPALAALPSVGTADAHRQLEGDGFHFHAAGAAFNQRGAFHTRAGVNATFARGFALEAWEDRGLDGFQDLSRLRRR